MPPGFGLRQPSGALERGILWKGNDAHFQEPSISERNAVPTRRDRSPRRCRASANPFRAMIPLPAKNPEVTHHFSAFTLLELLAVIAILGIIGALMVPALKNFGKSDASLTAAQQILRDVARARQLALADRTTVYMVFVPMNFWTNTTWLNSLATQDPALMTAVSNLCDKQLSGYAFVADGALGDQPGNHQWHYLSSSWQKLPEGNFIADWKFAYPSTNSFTDPFIQANWFKIASFNYTNNIPFPTELATNAAQPWPSLPYIAFNYLGQLVQYSDQDYSGSGVDIPLDKGSILPAINPSTKAFVFNTAQIIETPQGNSTNVQYNILHIDPLTGRGTLLFHQIQ